MPLKRRYKRLANQRLLAEESRDLFPQEVFLDLPARRHGEGGANPQAFGKLPDGHALVLEERDHLVEGERVPGRTYNEGADALRQHRIGHGDTRDTGHQRMDEQMYLALQGTDIGATADDN